MAKHFSFNCQGQARPGPELPPMKWVKHKDGSRSIGQREMLQALDKEYSKKVSPFRSPEKAKQRRKKRRKLEKTTERAASEKMREDGAKVVKLSLMGQKSWPDRLIFPPGATIRIYVCRTVEEAMDIYKFMAVKKEPFMIEFKREGEDLTELQAELHEAIGRFENHGKKKKASAS